MAECEFRISRARGVTLLELVAVLAMMGLFAAVAMARFGTAPLQNFASRADARRLALDLLQAQRRAVSTGNNHYIQFASSGGKLVGYTLYQRVGGSSQAADSERQFAQQETVTTTHNPVEYQFDGTALTASQITFTGPNQTWQVSVVPATGAVRMVQTAP